MSDINKFSSLKTRINEVTPEILRHYIKKIVVHRRMETKTTRTQEVEIHFNMIGSVQIPSIEEKAQYVKSFARKKEDQIALAI